MLKNILNLEGAQQLSKNEQSSINGGKTYCAHIKTLNCCEYVDEWIHCGFGACC